MLMIPLTVSLWLSPLEAAYRVTDLSFSALSGEVRINIQTDGPAQYSFFTMEEAPPRLVIDLAEAVHSLDRYQYEPSVTDAIRRIRTSQYRPYPHPVVRIVLDLQSLVPFEMAAVENGLAVILQRPSRTAIEEGPPDRKSGYLPAPEHGETEAEAPAAVADGEVFAGQVEAVTVEVAPVEAAPVETRPVEAAPAGKIQDEPADESAETISGPGSVEAIETGEASVTAEMTMGSRTSPISETSSEKSSAAAEEAAPDTAESKAPEGSLMSRLLALGIREPVSYHSDSRRDPFIPLPATQKVEFGQTPLPDVEKLSIVGILQGIDGYRALAQDDDDNGYVLRKGDRVLYGYVARIEAERLIFYLNRRGLDRTVILKIPQ